ncbi:MAG: peptidylprolyl isomerase [Bacteroidales bacterium]|nr:peptidylprolyl isomerase [Bacteroidales bacterium]MBR6160288.1 peptidylprolyl isomerase [Bacteroidales bacterium]
MKMRRLALSLVAIMAMGNLFAQSNSDILMKVGNEKVSKGEFVSAYQKNNLISEASEKDLREYLELYANYRMKVQEAESLRMDTSVAFQRELSSYKNQSAQQYLTDAEVTDQLLNEAYERSKYQIRASHILLRCLPTAQPKDTLAAYHKALQIRNEILNGLDFAEAAVKYSEDESARDFVNPQTKRFHYGNKGDLGYFSVMEMIYPFETGAFNTPLGQVSMPVRTQFGYHLIYVRDKVPAMAKIFISQIFINDSLALRGEARPEIKAKLAEIQTALKTNSFEEVVTQFSEDVASKEKQGRMDPFTPNRRPGNYVAAAIKLKPGQHSEPVASLLGWHILRLDSIVYSTVNEETRFMLKNKLSRDARSQKSKASLLNKLKKEYNYSEKGKAAAMKFFKKNLPESYFQSTRVAIDSLKGIEKLKPMCTYADQKITALEFARFVSRFQGTQLNVPVENFLEQIFQKLVGDKMLQYENTQLTSKYPEYRELVKEFHDGMLLYEINAKKVWNAAIQDSVGLERYYESVKTEYPVAQPNDSLQYKPLSEIRAIIINRYQDVLEQKWLQELKAKYPVVVDEQVFKSILKK